MDRALRVLSSGVLFAIGSAAFSDEAHYSAAVDFWRCSPPQRGAELGTRPALWDHCRCVDNADSIRPVARGSQCCAPPMVSCEAVPGQSIHTGDSCRTARHSTPRRVSRRACDNDNVDFAVEPSRPVHTPVVRLALDTHMTSRLPVYVIAEMAWSHNGSVKNALEILEGAHR